MFLRKSKDRGGIKEVLNNVYAKVRQIEKILSIFTRFWMTPPIVRRKALALHETISRYIQELKA